jgi:hypothetical protein
MNLDDKIELLGEILQADAGEEGNPEVLLQAVGQSFHCLAERGEDPEDDKWLADRDLFLRVIKPLIAEHWKRGNTADGQGNLPWDDGTLMRAWLEWRVPHAWQPRSCSGAAKAEPE